MSVIVEYVECPRCKRRVPKATHCIRCNKKLPYEFKFETKETNEVEPLIFHLTSIFAGILGIAFTVNTLLTPVIILAVAALIFDSVSVLCAVVAVLKEK